LLARSFLIIPLFFNARLTIASAVTSPCRC
jgi:hypothetical protein